MTTPSKQELGEREKTTLNGKFDARCVTCHSSPYCLWVSDEAPPPGCPEGFDATPHLCPWVYTNFVAVTLKIDGHISGDVSPVGRFMIEKLGSKADELMDHIRSGASPDEWLRKHGAKRRKTPRALPEASIQ